MKKILSVLFVSVMCFGLFAEDIFSYVPLTGGVKTSKQINYEISSKFGNYFRTPSSKLVCKYDDFGKEIESVELSEIDEVKTKTISSYDENGNLKEQITYDIKDNLLWKVTTEYKDGLKADVSEFDADGVLKSKTIFLYSDGKLIDETGYETEGALVWKTIYKYNEDGTQRAILHYNADGSLDEEQTFDYSEDGKISSIKYYDAFTASSSKKVFRYDGNDVLTDLYKKRTNKVKGKNPYEAITSK